ncbi:brix domain protein (macronuclear) [Tetrahymena thermophila SB210]|uniref:Brix domain protein n=1 Tax=Tetrahymena thermophila (strain SB210) TaxID=312017 RepID=Q231F4_TETTS|nr:brix domain protein [Tetrahymena thermophila SB210]EAR91085.2 brix domain protein [Tetrahymena thermophila SB210]|eukprot:XP_001011330.2 brix domain protein [Tetrahymena thermophila SB210]
MDAEKVFDTKKEERWINKQRCLIVASRGINDRHKHLIDDLISMMPHSKKDAKLEKREIPEQISELCFTHSCTSFMYFEARRKTDLYLWIGRFPDGPSAKFLIEHIHGSGELKCTGNCLKGSRHVISFDKSFSEEPSLKLYRELLTHIFNVPRYHPKSKPCTDHLLSFIYSDNKLWFRNYQLYQETQNKQLDNQELYEIGPRFVMTPIAIIDGTMMGEVLYKNPQYKTKTAIRVLKKREKMMSTMRKEQKKEQKVKTLSIKDQVDQADRIFEDQKDDSFEEEF